MKIYSIFAKSIDNPLDSLKAVSNGFSSDAFFWNILWLTYNHLWDYFIICFAILLCLINLAEFEILSFTLLPIFMILIPIALGIFGNDILTKELQKKGFKLIEIIAAQSADEAELKFLNNFLNMKKPIKKGK